MAAKGGSGAPEVLSTRALNRATLARQLLLERHQMTAAGAIEHLVGIQGQAPNAPYVGLWSRLAAFQPGELAGLLTARRAVRITLFRVTVHLVTARDCLAIRPLLETLLERSFRSSPFGQQLAGCDYDAIRAASRELLAERPQTRGELATALAARWPDRDPQSLGYAATYLEPLVQVPPRGLWGESGPAVWATVADWLGQPFETAPDLDALILRAIGALGPASVRDLQLWSGLTKLRAVIDRLRPRLRTFRDDAGVELFDLPDAPRPDPETPASPRFLPEYDNLLLSHADRRRVILDGRRVPLPPGNGGTTGTLLVDGFWRATWQIARDPDTATLTVNHFTPLTPAERASIADEGAQLLAFAAPDATHDLRFVQVD